MVCVDSSIDENLVTPKQINEFKTEKSFQIVKIVYGLWKLVGILWRYSAK